MTSRPDAVLAADAALDAALARAFLLLHQGVAEHGCALRTLTLGTRGPDGAPALRSVVLRGFDATPRHLHIHTDRRSAKVTEIAADPRVALHGYDPASRIQLRLAGHAMLHLDDAAAESAWTASRESSRMTYATHVPPGTALPAPAMAPADPRAGRANFALLIVAFDRLDWLLLDPAGHRRARFAWAADGALDAGWIAP